MIDWKKVCTYGLFLKWSFANTRRWRKYRKSGSYDVLYGKTEAEQELEHKLVEARWLISWENFDGLID